MIYINIYKFVLQKVKKITTPKTSEWATARPMWWSFSLFFFFFFATPFLCFLTVRGAGLAYAYLNYLNFRVYLRQDKGIHKRYFPCNLTPIDSQILNSRCLNLLVILVTTWAILEIHVMKLCPLIIEYKFFVFILLLLEMQRKM